MKGVRVCELCDGEAALFCPSDSAFLCWSCDAKVHQANFLVARHVRSPLCSGCNSLIADDQRRVSGAGSRPFRRICISCSHESHHLDSLSSSSTSSSACISNAESCSSPARFSGEATSKKTKRSRQRPAPNVDSKAEGVLVNWCRKLGIGGGVAVPLAVKAFVRGCSTGYCGALPSRVSLTASLWFGLRLCGDKSASTWQVMKRLEAISGVPAKLILAAESKLARAFLSSSSKRRSSPNDQPVEEGWAETQTEH